LWHNQSRRVLIDDELRRSCPACTGGRRDFLDAPISDLESVTSLCGRDAIQISGRDHLRGHRSLDLATMAQRWTTLGEVQSTRFFARVHLDSDIAVTLFRDGRAVIAGVRDAAHARSIYDRVVGS
ncbi:MAG: molybdopterin biosynthesis protein MoeB, partial [Planctomycetota bacterium]